MIDIEEARSRRQESSFAILAGRIATWYKESGLVQAVVIDDDFDDDIDIDDPANDKGEFVRSLWIADTDTPGKAARYQVVQSGREVFLARDGRAFALPARAKRMEVTGELTPATADDFFGLMRALPNLVEVAKYPAQKARLSTLRKIERALRPDKFEIAAQVPKVRQQIDPMVKDRLDFLMSPQEQFKRDFVYEDYEKPQAVFVASRQDLKLDEFEHELRTAQSDFKEQGLFLERAPDFSAIVPQGRIAERPMLSLVPSSPSL